MRILRDAIQTCLNVESGFAALLIIVFWLGWNTAELYQIADLVPQNKKRISQNSTMIEEIKSEQDGLRKDFRIYACGDNDLSDFAKKHFECNRFE